MPAGWFTTFTNCRKAIAGHIVDDHLVISEETGTILKRTGYIGGEIVDLDDGIIAPGYLELHANGVNGFHFTDFQTPEQYERRLSETARYYVTQGVTGFWVTIPTVDPETFQKILPHLRPRAFPSGATLLGAHVEGPYLCPTKAGAHQPSLFHTPTTTPDPSTVYGAANLGTSVKLVTLAPELPGAEALIAKFVEKGVRVSLGHSAATYEQGLRALRAGATCLTHTFNAMAPLHHREPGLAGLITLPLSADGTSSSSPPPPNPDPPYFSHIPDSHHVHPSLSTLLLRASPARALLVTDSVELANLPNGTYSGNAQIPGPQHKAGTRAYVETLVGGCVSLARAVQNVARWSACGVAGAARCVGENVAGLMGLDDEAGMGRRGRLEEGFRADLVVLDDEGDVLQTWVAGTKVWERE
ncbi:hypothetical protein BDY21DRAFT_315343 [Lineolata rhizophorae]|uniref:N-acetylglucosamine-6-phosphate deacetylase n=1 Tax=Lineolata rhizophorae TaxID=578093 RepID=A0A6A6P8M2_9PEZI|nr:hypothetical protein BDY21DRAFT_315343 [Lineolata rhizophorae]